MSLPWQQFFALFLAGKQNHVLLQESTDQDVTATPFPPFSVPPSSPSPPLTKTHSPVAHGSEQTHSFGDRQGRHSVSHRHAAEKNGHSSSSGGGSRRDFLLRERDSTAINGIVEEPTVSVHGKGRKRARRSSKSHSHHQDDRLRDRVEKERPAFVLGVGLSDMGQSRLTDAADQASSLAEDDSSGASSSLSTHIPMGVVDGLLSSGSDSKSIPLLDNHVKKMPEEAVTELGFSPHHQLAGLKVSHYE